jgi:hypothetical protein
VFLVDHNGCLSSSTSLVACCFLLAFASGHCLAGRWKDVVLVLVFIPKSANSLVLIDVSRLLPAFLLASAYLADEWCFFARGFVLHR